MIRDQFKHHIWVLIPWYNMHNNEWRWTGNIPFIQIHRAQRNTFVQHHQSTFTHHYYSWIDSTDARSYKIRHTNTMSRHQCCQQIRMPLIQSMKQRFGIKHSINPACWRAERITASCKVGCLKSDMGVRCQEGSTVRCQEGMTSSNCDDFASCMAHQEYSDIKKHQDLKSAASDRNQQATSVTETSQWYCTGNRWVLIRHN